MGHPGFPQRAQVRAQRTGANLGHRFFFFLLLLFLFFFSCFLIRDQEMGTVFPLHAQDVINGPLQVRIQ